MGRPLIEYLVLICPALFFEDDTLHVVWLVWG